MQELCLQTLTWDDLPSNDFTRTKIHSCDHIHALLSSGWGIVPCLPVLGGEILKADP